MRALGQAPTTSEVQTAEQMARSGQAALAPRLSWIGWVGIGMLGVSAWLIWRRR